MRKTNLKTPTNARTHTMAALGKMRITAEESARMSGRICNASMPWGSWKEPETPYRGQKPKEES